MPFSVSRRGMLGALTLPLAALVCSKLGHGPRAAGAQESPVSSADLLAVTCARGRHLAIVDTASSALDLIEVGAAPHGLAVLPDGRAFVATAEGVAVVDVRGRQRTALLPYQVDVGSPRVGEYRPGGMGIAATPGGRRVAVAVYTSAASTLEIVDAIGLTTLRSVSVGTRPFQVVASLDGQSAYSIDHDGYTVTVVDLATGTARALTAAPLGRGAFDKPHYAAQMADGTLLLPYQGRLLQVMNPADGSFTSLPLSAATHQHGIVLTPDEQRAVIVGTGPAGGVSGPPSLTIVTLASGAEEIIPLRKPHERVVLSQDGRRAYLTGGYLLTGGWDGITVVDLETHQTREIGVPDGPLDVALLS